MKILLTGARGMVGQNLLLHEGAEQYDLITPDRRQVDLSRYDLIKKHLSEVSPDMIIHCAGLVGGIQANVSRPRDFLLQNTIMGCNLVAAAQENGVSQFLNLASSCMYPKLASNPLKESALV